MKTHVLKRTHYEQVGATADTDPGAAFPPRSVHPSQPKPRTVKSSESSLRTYTEHEVAEMLKVSVSQLRKWRADKAQKNQGPPFKKFGRSVRYPELGLIDFINAR